MTAFTSRFLVLWAVLLAVAISCAPVEAAARKKQKTEPEHPAFDLPMRVVIVRNNIGKCEPLCPQWISAEGQIMPNSPYMFKKALASLGDQKLPVVITSPGGDVDAALAIGEIIHKRGLDVAVGGTYFGGCAPRDKKCKLPKEQDGVYRGVVISGQGFCVSACPLILAAGAHRISGPGTYIGVHQISRTISRERVRYFERYQVVNGKKKILSRKVVSRKPMKSYVSTKLDKRLQKKLFGYLKKMGVDNSLLALFNRAPPTAMYQLTSAELKTTGLITDATSSADLTQGSLCSATPPAANCVALQTVVTAN